ncbi:MAG: 30S ribosomal protein S16 [Burkholderiales bacterium]
MADKRRARDGKFIERIGFYDPLAPQGHESLRIALDRMNHWQGQGAQVSDTVARLVRQLGAQKNA